MAAEVVEFTAQDREDHAADEAIVDRGLVTFVEVGAALMRIRDRGSYVLTHPTFSAYIEARWAMSKAYAYDVMNSAEVTQTIEAHASDLPLPPNPSVAHELRPLLDRPDDLVALWRELVTRHQGPPIGRLVREAVHQLRRAPAPAPPPVPEPEDPEPQTDAQIRFTSALADLDQALRTVEELEAEAFEEANQALLAQWLTTVDPLWFQLRGLRSSIRSRAAALRRQATRKAKYATTGR